MKSVILSLCAVLLLAGAAFATKPNAIVVPKPPAIVATGVPAIPAPPVAAPVAPVAPAAPTPAKILADLQTVSVLVKVDHGSGSGTLVTRQVGDVTRSYVWTAGHVVREQMKSDKTFKNVTIHQEFRYKGRAIGSSDVQAKVIAYSDPEEGEDLALLEILQDNFRPATVSATFDLTADLQEIGTKLVHVGCTQGLYNSVSYGVISQTDVDLIKTGKMFDQTSTMAYPGSSGGGMFLEDGKYMGMLTRGGGAGLNFIVPLRRILPWAKTMGVEWALDPTVKVTAIPKMCDGTEQWPQGGSILGAIRACIKANTKAAQAIINKSARPYFTAI